MNYVSTYSNLPITFLITSQLVSRRFYTHKTNFLSLLSGSRTVESSVNVSSCLDERTGTVGWYMGTFHINDPRTDLF